MPKRTVVPRRQYVGSEFHKAREDWQRFSDQLHLWTPWWHHGAADACAPTMVFCCSAEGASPPMHVWVGPVDIALDDAWLRMMQVACL